MYGECSCMGRDGKGREGNRPSKTELIWSFLFLGGGKIYAAAGGMGLGIYMYVWMWINP